MTTFEAAPRLGALVLYTRQFSALIDAGVSIMRTFQLLAQTTGDSVLKAANEELSEQVGGGQTLSDAMAQRPDIFSAGYVGFIKAGEVGGVLQEALAYLADWLEQERVALERLQMRVSLLRLAESAARRTEGSTAEEGIFAAMSAARRPARVASFCRAFEMCLTAGVPQPLALVTAAGLLEEPDAEHLRLRAGRLEGKRSIADLLEDVDDLRLVVAPMVRIGEEHACLDHMLRHAAEFYDAEAAHALDSGPRPAT
jgi:type II secretory pathway component PulF